MGSPVHSLEDKERGLAALVIAGSSFKASEITGIPPSTLRDWKSENRERYEQLRHELEPQVARTIAAEAETIALRLTDREHALIDALDDNAIGTLKPADVAAALRNIGTAKALQIDKLSSPLRERPSHVQQGHSPDELVNRMARALGITITDSTATEIPQQQTLPSVSGSVNARTT